MFLAGEPWVMTKKVAPKRYVQPDVSQAMASGFVSNCYVVLMNARGPVDNAGCEELGW